MLHQMAATMKATISQQVINNQRSTRLVCLSALVTNWRYLAAGQILAACATSFWRWSVLATDCQSQYWQPAKPASAHCCAKSAISPGLGERSGLPTTLKACPRPMIGRWQANLSIRRSHSFWARSTHLATSW